MNRKKLTQQISKIGFSALMTASFLAGPSAFSAHRCEPLFQVQKDFSKKLYAKGIDPKKIKDGHFQVSYESEYLFSESAALLHDYAPQENVMKLTDWKALTDAQRINWIQSKFSNKPEFAVESGLRKVVDVDFLPKELIVDSTGNLEIVIDPPLNTYKEWENVVDYITQKYGPGSQQAMVSKPREAGFTNGKQSQNVIDQHLGWLNYTNLFDMFEKLNQGYVRYQKDSSKMTALSFDHPFVGPMNKIKRDVLEFYLQSNSNLEKYDDVSKAFVRKSDASFKYTSGPSYRPDVAGPYRWSWEIRNAHKDVQGLKDKVLRDVEAHSVGLDGYQAFAKVSAFDSVAEFNKLAPPIKSMLAEIFPSKADPSFQYSAEEKRVLETYRNFSMPLMNMKILIESLSDSKNLAINIKKYNLAKLKYLDALSVVSQKFLAQKINASTAKADVMGLIGKWSTESGLFELFLEKAKTLNHDKSIQDAQDVKKAG